MNSKTCSKCKVTKPLDQFYKNRSFEDGLAYWCAACQLDCNRKNYESKPRQKFDDVQKFYEGDVYVCHCCDYKTRHHSNMGVHLNSKKHERNSQDLYQDTP
jgi:hypothetical protein